MNEIELIELLCNQGFSCSFQGNCLFIKVNKYSDQALVIPEVKKVEQTIGKKLSIYFKFSDGTMPVYMGKIKFLANLASNFIKGSMGMNTWIPSKKLSEEQLEDLEDFVREMHQY